MNEQRLKRKQELQFAKQSMKKSHYLYGKMNIWKAMLQVGTTGIAIAFFSGLFTFVDQLLLVNLMPDTKDYSFVALFADHGIFNNLIKNANLHLTSQEQYNFALSVANYNGLGFYSSDSVIRAAVSLTIGVSDFVFVIPAIYSIGLAVQYSIALGQNNLLKVKHIWQNAFYGTIIVTILGMILAFILTALVVPAQTSKTVISSQDILVNLQNNLHYLSNNQTLNFSNISETLFYSASLNEYFTAVYSNNHLVGYINLNDEIHNAKILTSLNNLIAFNLNYNDIVNTWNAYFALSNTYSIKFAEEFCYIITGGLLAFSFASLITSLLRSEGAIAVVTIIGFITVAINIILDYILIWYGEIGMAGAAVASIIGWLMQFGLCYLYLKLNKKIHEHLHTNFSDLKWNHNLALNLKLMFSLMYYGFSVFIGSIGLAIFDILLTREVSIVSSSLMGTFGSEYYLSILGAVLPIVNLFTMSLIGLIQYASPVFSYNYGHKQYARFQQAFWASAIYSLVFSVIVYVIICFIPAVTDGVLNWFRINANSANYELVAAIKLLRIWMVQIIAFALAMGGMLCWLTANRPGLNTWWNIFRPFIVYIIVLYVFSAITLKDSSSLNAGISNLQDHPENNNAIWFFMWNNPASTIIGSGIWFLFSIWFIYKDVPREKKKISEFKIIKWLKEEVK